MNPSVHRSMTGLLTAVLLFSLLLSNTHAEGTDKIASSSPEAEKLYKEAMALLEESLTEANLGMSITLLERASVIDPGSEAIWIQLSWRYWLLGEDLPKETKDQRKRRTKLFEKGEAAGEKAMNLEKRSVGGLYWYTVNHAAAGEMKGVLSSLSLAGTIFSNMSRVDRRDPYYLYGATRRLTSEVFVRVPGWLSERFGFKPEYIEEDLLINLERWPNYFDNYTFLARVYIWSKEKEKALEMLSFVLKTPADIMPEEKAENERQKGIARTMWKEFTRKEYPER